MNPPVDPQAKAEARRGWLLSAPALLLLAVGATGPLFIMLAYSFLEAGQYGNVEWALSWKAWFNYTIFYIDQYALYST